MSTTVVWTDEDKPGGLDEVEITDDWTIIVDGRAQVTNAQVHKRGDGGTTYVLTVKVAPPPAGSTTMPTAVPA